MWKTEIRMLWKMAPPNPGKECLKRPLYFGYFFDNIKLLCFVKV